MRRRVVALIGMAMLSACGLLPLDDFVELGGATWALPPDAAIDPETTEFVALVTEIECASGQASDGRIPPPQITYGADSVTVTFSVQRLEGAQACPGNPATPVTVTLTEPLGARELLDGGLSPAQAPPECAVPPFCT